jgi:pimeloyl-ACP methyl ester carboxylesterase
MTNEATATTLEGADAIRLAVDRRGDPDRPVVVLLHGAGQTRHAWHRTASHLASAGFCTVAVDLRGHGDSDRAPDGDYRRHAFAADIQALRRQLGPLAAVVGASLGGISALLAHDQNPGGIADALVLVDIAPRIEKAGSDRILAFMAERPEGFSSVEEVAKAVAAYNPHRAAPDDLDGLRRNLRLGDDGRYRWHWDPKLINGAKSLMSARDPEALHAAAHRLRVPCLLVRGRQSDLLTEDGAAEFCRAVPHAEYLDIHGAGHMVAGDTNDPFTSAVVNFLAPLAGRQRERA